MAPTAVVALGSNVASSAVATRAFNTTAAVPAGGKIILRCFQMSFNEVVSGVSGGGLTWVNDLAFGGTTAGGDKAISIWSADCPVGLASGTTITVTWASATFADRSVHGVYTTGAGAKDKTASSIQNTASTSLTSTVTATRTDDNELLIGAGAVFAGAFTPTGSLLTEDFDVTQRHGASGLVTATGTQAYTATITSGRYFAGIVTYGDAQRAGYRAPRVVRQAVNRAGSF